MIQTVKKDCYGNIEKRCAGIDLLKIILAFMVIILHINAGGTGQALKYAVEKPYVYIIKIFTLLCYPAVNCYILITGYFLCKSKKTYINLVKSLIDLWITLSFFSIIGYFIANIIQGYSFNILELSKRFFPLTRQTWWFFNIYFVIVCISPFLNKLIDTLSKQEHKVLLSLSILVSSIHPYIVDWKDKLGVNYGNSLVWFIILYLTGAYLRKYKALNISNSKKQFLLYLITTSITFLLPPILKRFDITIQLATYNSILIYFQSIALFRTFLSLIIPQTIIPKINSLAKLSLASYLFHCQEDINIILWANITIYDFSNTYMIIPVSIILCLLLYLISIALEDILNHIKNYFNLKDKINTFIGKLSTIVLN